MWQIIGECSHYIIVSVLDRNPKAQFQPCKYNMITFYIQTAHLKLNVQPNLSMKTNSSGMKSGY